MQCSRWPEVVFVLLLFLVPFCLFFVLFIYIYSLSVFICNFIYIYVYVTSLSIPCI